MKITKGQSKAVNRRRTENEIVERKRTNNNVQNTTQKSEDRAPRTPLKQGMNSGRVNNSSSTSITGSVTLVSLH